MPCAEKFLQRNRAKLFWPRHNQEETMAFIEMMKMFIVQMFCAMDRDEGDSITSITTVTAKHA